jgi:NAD(P)-dependent dehydrogenase (short-subunit alcohol dehydrogenase family)
VVEHSNVDVFSDNVSRLFILLVGCLFSKGQLIRVGSSPPFCFFFFYFFGLVFPQETIMASAAKTVLVTGANRGLGLEFVRQYLARGLKVIGVCRKTSAELAQMRDVTVIDGVDVTDGASVKSLAHRLQGSTIDLLINNAGYLVRDKLESIDFDEVQRQIEINAIGPLRVTQALLPSLVDGGKVVIITSRMGSIEDNSSGGY